MASLSRPGSCAPSRRGSTRPFEDEDDSNGRHGPPNNNYNDHDDEVSPKSAAPPFRHFERLINIPSDLVHKLGGTESTTLRPVDHKYDHDNGHDNDRNTSIYPPIRRRSSLFSLQLPVSRRRLVRLSLLCTVVVLFVMTLGSGARNRRRTRMIAAASGSVAGTDTRGEFRWPAWVDAGSSLRLNPKSTAGRTSKGLLGRKLQRSLRDLGLMPVFLDGVDLPHSASHGSSSAHSPLRRRLNPVTTPPGELKIQARAAQEEVRQGMAEGQVEDGEDGDTMPWFWGNVDEVGSSPFDHLPELDLADEGDDRQKGKRVLFLTDYHDYLERMNTHTYEIVDSALRHPLISRVDVWGPGWNGWDPEMNIGENVRRRMWRVSEIDKVTKKKDKDEKRARAGDQSGGRQREGDDWAGIWKDSDHQVRLEEQASEMEKSTVEDGVKMGKWLEVVKGVAEGCPAESFDLVWTISDIFKQNDKRLSPMPCGALLAQQIGDCHSLNCFKEWYPYSSNITVTKYAFEMLDVYNPERLKASYPDMSMHLFGHSPDSANQWDFFPSKWSERKHDAQMFGFTGSFYPLRTVVTNAINDGKDTVIKRFQHPGYTIWEDPKAYEDPLETYTIDHPYYQKHIRMRQDFAEGLRSSKICVFDSSLSRKAIRKYAQAFLSGCVVAGDIPTEHEEAFEKFMIKLHPDNTIEQIDEILKKALLDEEELKRKAFLAFAYARKYLTNTNKITQMLRLVDKHNEGARGYDLPYGFSLRCRAYWSNEDSHRPPWCQGYRGLEGKPRAG